MSLAPELLLPLALVLLVAGFINGAIGLGFALLAVNVLAILLGAKEGIVVMSLLTPLISGLQLWHQRAQRAITGRLVTLLAGAVVGSIVGTQLLVILPGHLISLGLGLFTVAYVVGEIRAERPPLASGTERRLAPAAGFVAGVSNGALGASGPVVGSYLTAIGVRGREFVYAISLTFFVMGLVRGALLASLGQYTPAIVTTAAVLFIPSVSGQRLGQWFQGRLPARAFQRAVLVVLLVGSVNLLYRGVDGVLAATAGQRAAAGVLDSGRAAPTESK